MVNTTEQLLTKHFQDYPKLQAEDIFKYLFQSAFGCEHLVSSESSALAYIKSEYETQSKTEAVLIEPLDGEYSRVHLSCLNGGLTPETLARIFCLSAKKEEKGEALLEQKIMIARNLIADGILPIDLSDFDIKLRAWRDSSYPAVHHSADFRASYHPAYRVVANRYADHLQLFTKIDNLLGKGNTIVTIEGGSASGKTTLAGILHEVYDCNVFHMDDFFLRPEQRTPARFAEIGGNVDRERFCDEILTSLKKSETVHYRPFDCSTQTLKNEITVAPKRLTVVEGVYSMHPEFEKYYDLAVFLDIDPEYQRTRILKRNSPQLAKRFFEEWIPLENRYFAEMNIKERCSEHIAITKDV